MLKGFVVHKYVTLVIVYFAFSVSCIAAPESLVSVYDRTFTNSHFLKASEYNVKGEKALRRQALSLVLPNIQFETDFTHIQRDQRVDRNNPFLGVQDDYTEEDEFNLSLKLNQSLFNLSNFYNISARSSSVEQSKLQYQNNEQQLTLEVATRYLNVLRLGARLVAFKSAESTFLETYRSEQANRNSGIGVVSDLMEAKAVYDAAVADTIAAKDSLGNAFELLSELSGIKHYALLSFNEKLRDIPLIYPDQNGLLESVLSENLQLKIQSKLVEVEKWNLKSSRSAYAPTINLDVGYTEGDVSNRFSNQLPFDEELEGFFVSVKFEMPIYSGGGIGAETKRAKYRLLSERENRLDTVRILESATRSELLRFNTSKRQLNARQSAVVSSQEAIDSVRRAYQSGTEPLQNLLDVQRLYYLSVQNYYDSLFTVLTSSLRLELLLGDLNRDDLVTLESYLDFSKSVSYPKYE